MLVKTGAVEYAVALLELWTVAESVLPELAVVLSADELPLKLE